MTNFNEKFAEYIAELPALTGRLRDSRPLTLEEIAKLSIAGVYSFSEKGKVLYIGRTRNFRNRHKNHCHEKSKENTAAFAFRLARIATGKLKPAYKPAGSRKELMDDPEFFSEFEIAKASIRAMEVRFVEITDSKMQVLLELYASMELCSKHNEFETS